MSEKSDADLDFELQQAEAEARKRTAWGVFGAETRSNQYQQSLGELEKGITTARGDVAKKEAQKKKQDFITKSRRSTRMYVA